jgi:hypothetical protein
MKLPLYAPVDMFIYRLRYAPGDIWGYRIARRDLPPEEAHRLLIDEHQRAGQTLVIEFLDASLNQAAVDLSQKVDRATSQEAQRDQMNGWLADLFKREIPPARSDERGREEWWRKSLGQHHSLDDVIRNAAQCLALRDAEIARLEAQLQEAT